MVNPGHRSTGCLRCKDRRVKCDSTRPACLRCEKFGVSCPGYGNSNEPKFKIIDDTYRTTVRARKTYAKLGKAVDDNSSLNALQSSSRDQEAVGANTQSKNTKNPIRKISHSQLLLYPRLSTPSFLQGAVAPLVSVLSDPTQDIYWGVFEQATSLYENGSRHFKASIEALSLLELSLNQASQGYDIRVSAIKSYGYALQLINESVSGLDTQVMDQTIMAIFLAIIVERRLNVVQARGSGLSHFLAIMKLMQMRGKLQLATLIGRQLLLNACLAWHGMVMPLPQPIPCPIDDETCRLLTIYSNDRHAHSYQLIPLLNRGILLRKYALGILHNMNSAPSPNKKRKSRIHKILSQIESLEYQFEIWYDALPSNCTLSGSNSTNLTINSMRAHLIFLDDLKVRCHRSLTKTDHTDMYFEKINLSAFHTRRMVDQMCATMPYDFNLDTLKVRTENVSAVTSPPGGIHYFYHASFSFPLLVASMVNAGMPSAQSHSIIAARRANTQAMRLAQPVRIYPIVLVELDNECEPMLLCKTCGTEIHYASQMCPGPLEMAAPGDAGLRQSLATFRDRKDLTNSGDGEDINVASNLVTEPFEESLLHTE